MSTTIPPKYRGVTGALSALLAGLVVPLAQIEEPIPRVLLTLLVVLVGFLLMYYTPPPGGSVEVLPPPDALPEDPTTLPESPKAKGRNGRSNGMNRLRTMGVA